MTYLVATEFFFKTVLVEDLGRALREESEQWALRKADFPPVSRYAVRDIFEFVRQAKEAEAKKGDNGAISEGNEASQQPGYDQLDEGSDPLGGATSSGKNNKQED